MSTHHAFGAPRRGLLLPTAATVLVGLLVAWRAGTEPSSTVIGLQDAGAGTTAGLAVARFANYLAATATAGFLLVATVLLPATDRLTPQAAAASRRAAVAAAAWAITALALFAYGLSNVSARPLPEALAPDLVGRFAQIRFGELTLAQAALAMVVCVVAVSARTHAGASAALAVAAFGALAPALWGHAGSTQTLRPLAVASDAVHLLGAATWLGGLLALVWLATGRREPDLDLAVPVRRFSRLAGWTVAALLVTGVGSALFHVDAADQLLGTNWGRLLLLKAALLAALLWFAQAQRRRAIPALSGPARNPGAFRTLALAEVGLMLVAMGTAATMASGAPADVEAANRISSVAVPLGDGQLNATLDPAQVGSNEFHIYVLDDTGRQRPDAADAETTLTSGSDEVTAELFVAGPGHWTTPALTLPAAGDWQLRITALLDGEPATATATITVR